MSMTTAQTPATPGESRLKVAIVGGGIGGLCLALGLADYAHVDVHIYEAAPAFSEIGAGVACGANAARALSLISPKLAQAYRNCATHDALPDREDVWFPVRHGQKGKNGEEPGEEIWTIKYSNADDLKLGVRPRSCLHRADFLAELVRQIPEGSTSFGKAFRSFDIDTDNESIKGAVRLHFTDGTTATADIVIGCDGIKSAVRSAMMKETGRTVEPTYTGVYAYRALVPTPAARKVLPEELATCGSIYCAYNGYSTNYPVSRGDNLNVIILCNDLRPKSGVAPSWPHDTWQAAASKEEMILDLEGWHPGLLELMKDFSTNERWAVFHLAHNEPYTHSSGFVTIMGDAAHAATPHMGAGAGQAIEDAFVLSRLIGAVQSLDQASAALRAYDTVRRPRSQQLVRYSAKAMQMYTDVKDDTEEALLARTELEKMYRWIWEEDLEAEVLQALELMERGVRVGRKHIN